MTANHPSNPLALLVADTPFGNAAANYLLARFPALHVFQEPREARKDIVARRRKIVGTLATAEQMAASVLIRLAGRKSSTRIAELCSAHGLDVSRPPAARVTAISSVNGEDARRALAALQPVVVAVYGTRLIGARTLAAVPAPFVNYHAGLTPTYRGQHPGYWALASGDPSGAGVTVHLVDTGVDTGRVLAQAHVPLDPCTDTIMTYQWVQLPVGLALLEQILVHAISGAIDLSSLGAGGSDGWAAKAGDDMPRDRKPMQRPYLPPTLRQYLFNGMKRNVW
ncbi:MAG: formyl transferase [Hyphomicrobiaceae bacterium]